MECDAVILARGGSKGIPRKNLLPFCGIPLVQLSLFQAITAERVRNVYLSSDSDEILALADDYPSVIKVRRPDQYATDTAKSEEAILHWLSTLEEQDQPNIVLMLEPTAPLRKSGDIDTAISLFEASECDSMFSGAFLEDFLIWKRGEDGQLKSINYDYLKQGPRQLRSPDIVENGALYLFTPELIKETGNRFGGKIEHVKNEFWQSFEIDSPEDWDFVEMIYNKYINNSLG